MLHGAGVTIILWTYVSQHVFVRVCKEGGCIHAWVHNAWVHTCMGAYMHGCIHAWVHTCMGAYMHGCMHVNIYISGNKAIALWGCVYYYLNK